MIDYVAARKKMVENQLRTSAITDRRLLAVMAQIPREIFVPEARRDLAYIDDVHRLGSASPPRYLAAPAPFGRLLQLASVSTDDRVLDLGCGTGYSTAILASLATTVIAVESDSALAAAARANLSSLGLDNAQIVDGSPEQGAAGDAPFDLIMLEGAVDIVPAALFAQLADGGRLVALLKRGAVAVAQIYVRSGDDVAARAEFDASLPPLPAPERPSEFTF